MRVTPSPRLHLFVCANRREGSPLGPGCADRGEALYGALKAEVANRRAYNEIWVTKTHCLGICPKRGATVARYPGPSPILSDVELGDVEALLAPGPDAPAPALAPAPAPAATSDAPAWAAIEKELLAVEELQTQKVLDLARRLKP